MNYWIQGDAANAERIRAAFEKLGYEKVNVIHIGDYANERLFFFTENGKVRSTLKDCGIANIIKTHPDYKELELPKPHYDISNFHAGMPVLIRDAKGEEWRYTEFSHLSSRFETNKFCAGCTYWRQCIPFNDDTKHLLGTTDPCDEQYINW